MLTELVVHSHFRIQNRRSRYPLWPTELVAGRQRLGIENSLAVLVDVFCKIKCRSCEKRYEVNWLNSHKRILRGAPFVAQRSRRRIRAARSIVLVNAADLVVPLPSLPPFAHENEAMRWKG